MLTLLLTACGAGAIDHGATAVDVSAADTADPATGDAGDTAGVTAADTAATPTEPADTAAPPASRCAVGELTLTCEHHSTTLLTGFSGLLPREVHWQVPLGDPPPAGWPAVILFQGSLFTAELFWVVIDVDVFGFWNQGLLTKALLDGGFAVITPEAHAGGGTAWDTNIPPMSLWWELSEDHQFMLDIFGALDGGGFGPVDPGRLYAAGISSGGYMTSRMDLEYRERFRALAIQSGSYATCGGPVCAIPALDAGHLPTLFLHGADDVLVPVWTMEPYHEALAGLGVGTEKMIQEGVGHAWIDPAPEAIAGWFQRY